MALEALAINYLTHTVRAWIAFLTAALSFWKTKYSSSPPPSSSSSPSPPQSPPAPAPAPAPPLHQISGRQEYALLSWTSTLENRRSGKFRVYYGEDEDDHNEKRNSKLQVIRHNNYYGEDGWEALLKLKTAEMGWHRYQDLTALDGSVVRLWNH